MGRDVLGLDSGSVAEDPRRELVQVIRELYQLQLVTATGGNLSVRVAGKETCWITPTRLHKGSLRPEAMVRIDFQGRPLDAGALVPSSEWAMHVEIYKARPDVQAVIHAHAPYATILGLSGLRFLPITAEAVLLGEVAAVPFVMPGTRELALAVVRALGPRLVCLLKQHGVVVVAGSLRRAANLVEIVERTAQLIVGCYAAGREPCLLSAEEIEALRGSGKTLG